ncbi:phage holin family protein [Micromonospora sp. NPDC049559]|uniref:phage holin family protein n=1 Tax=Micromonospora sp. NPDC049559 TaxID=3155923 RepID=UPI003440381C
MTGPGQTGGSPPPIGDRLALDLADLVRQELSRLRFEALAAVRRAGPGAGWGGAFVLGAGVAAVLGVGATSTALRKSFESALPPGRAAAVLAGAYFAGAAALGVVGLRRLRAAGCRLRLV